MAKEWPEKGREKMSQIQCLRKIKGVSRTEVIVSILTEASNVISYI